MTTFKQELRAYLIADTDTAAIVDTRVYPAHVFPQGTTPPCITYFQLAEVTVVGRLVRAHLQFDCWAATDLAATTLADTLREALAGFHGAWGSLHVNSTVVNISDGPPLPTAGLYRQLLEAQVFYQRPAT